jgi:hypothetical protein
MSCRLHAWQTFAAEWKIVGQWIVVTKQGWRCVLCGHRARRMPPSLKGYEADIVPFPSERRETPLAREDNATGLRTDPEAAP